MPIKVETSQEYLNVLKMSRISFYLDLDLDQFSIINLLNVSIRLIASLILIWFAKTRYFWIYKVFVTSCTFKNNKRDIFNDVILCQLIFWHFLCLTSLYGNFGLIFTCLVAVETSFLLKSWLKKLFEVRRL